MALPPIKQKYIESPEKLWEYFMQYCKWVENNPILIEDYVGKDAERVIRQKPRPYTIEGFNNWLFTNNITSNIWDYLTNKNGSYSAYSNICSRVKECIRENQIAGGMAGIFNPSITQRLNGLVEKTENKNENNNTNTTTIKWGDGEIQI